MIEFELSGDYIELNKLLKASGLCGTGGEAGQCIVDGHVKVNGQVETRKRNKILRGSLVALGNQTVRVI